MKDAERHSTSPHAAWLVFDPLPAWDAAERNASLVLHLQQRMLEHCGELGWAWGVFALRRMAEPAAALRRFSERPSPEAAVEMAGHLVSGTMTDLAEEAGRCTHLVCAGLEDTAGILRREARIATEALVEPEID